MLDLIRSILKWMIIAIIIILVILVFAKLTHKEKKVVDDLDNGVQTIKKTTKETIEDGLEPLTDSTEETPTDTTNNNTLVVDTPNTGTKEDATTILGIIIIGSTFYYIHKKSNQIQN